MTNNYMRIAFRGALKKRKPLVQKFKLRTTTPTAPTLDDRVEKNEAEERRRVESGEEI